MNGRAVRLLFLVLATLFAVTDLARLSAQSNSEPTQLIWALDQASTPVIRVYDPTGAERFTLALPGSGQARAIHIDEFGFVYVCRGNSVYELNPMGVATGVVFNAPAGASTAQHCARLPTNDFIVSFGATAAASMIVRYDPTGTVLTTISNTALNIPRALLPDPLSNRVYVANRGANTILSFDYTQSSPSLSLTVDLNSQMIGPIGLAWDSPGSRMWVVGDHGQTQAVGTVTVASPAFTSQFSYPPSSAAGLTAPAGAYFDRFRNLYLAGRSVNSGTAGVYVFDARTSPPVFLARFPRTGTAPTNVIDVALAPATMTTCVPKDGTSNVFIQGAVNKVNFDCPTYPNAIYAAALSFRFQPTCSVSTFGSIPNTLRFGSPDTRGIPLNDDLLFRGSAGVGGGGPSPVPMGIDLTNLFGPGQGIGISGFIGTLDAMGHGVGFVNLSTVPLNPVQVIPTDFEVSIAWLIFDSSVASGIGFVSRPECVKLRVTPNNLVICPP